MSVESNNVPPELRETPPWIDWRYAIRDGKRTREPINPHTGKRASSTDPATWGTYEQAKAACDARGLDSVGFVFTRADSFCGVDLDGCRNPETGELAPWAQRIIGELDSYTEVSPSGTGIHVIVKGTLPPGGRKRGPVEMYDEGRFFTVTGTRVDGTSWEIEERDDALGQLHRREFGEPAQAANGHGRPRDGNGLSDQEVIARAMRAKNGAEFASLWAGEQNGHASHSEADLDLCSKLGFWTGGDPEAVDRLFRQSRLYRPKWDERHYGDGRTYGQATVEKSLEGAANFYDPKSQSLYRNGIWDDSESEGERKGKRPRLRSVRFNEIPDPGPRRYLVEGLIPQGYPTILHGDGGAAKSMLALSLGLALARNADGEDET